MGDSDGASHEGASSWSDLSLAQNNEGAGADGGNSTAGIEYAAVVSSAERNFDPKVSIGTQVINSAKVEGDDCCYSNTGSASHKFPVPRRSFMPTPVPASFPLSVLEKHCGALLTDPWVQCSAQPTGL